MRPIMIISAALVGIVGLVVTSLPYRSPMQRIAPVEAQRTGAHPECTSMQVAAATIGGTKALNDRVISRRYRRHALAMVAGVQPTFTLIDRVELVMWEAVKAPPYSSV